ncbi:hypothetical protein DFH27DRAFT_239426 [Peziza echinospora]|nr:hypothetical protein DFH27DRAFT_239426 [Peziza echinospora]
MPRGSAASSSSKRHNPHTHSILSQTNGSIVSAVKRPARSRSSSNTAAPSASAQNGAAAYEPSPLGSGQQHTQHLHQSHHRQHQSSSTSDTSSVTSGEAGSDWSTKFDGATTLEGLNDEMSMLYSNGVNGLAMGGEHRKIDINPSTDQARLFGVNTSTVLPSFPLLDSITLLIIFLQLPSTVLTIIHFLFATMTFVPPSTTLLSASTASSLPSFTTLLLQGSAGSPSILTVIVADILVAIISIFLWPSARILLIDFAQAVMAISLGAGNTGQTSGTLKNAAVCAGVLSGAKVIRNRYEFGDPWSMSAGLGSGGHSVSPILGFTGISNNSASWVRNALAVHIVAQGAMRALRGWLIQRPAIAHNSDSGAMNPAISFPPKDGSSLTGKQKDKDPEAGSVITSSPLPTPVENGKKKKKQNTIVRGRQPLWAALASTVVHIAKEVEQSHAVSEATSPEDEAASGSKGSKAPGLEGRVWITNIASTEISFGSGYFPGFNSDDSAVVYPDGGNHSGQNAVAGGKNDFVPFFVRVNGIAWPQTDIHHPGNVADVERGDISENRDEVWVIDISGLTPATEYDFEFVKSKGGLAFYQTSACTMPAQASSITAAVPPPVPSSRPLSPVTTLLNTLSQANSTLTEQKARIKRTKKENNRRLASIRTEIDTLKSRLGSGDKGEERARRRVLSLREFVRRAEEEVAKMTAELERLENIPEEVEKEWKLKKQLLLEEQNRLQLVENQAEEAKAAAGRQASAIETEAAAVSSKQEKLSARLAKLKADMERLTAENTAAREEKTRKQAERDALVKHRAAMDAEFSEAIGKMEKKMQEYRTQSSENWGLAIALENAAAQQASLYPPSTPEGGLPTARGPIGPNGSSTSILAKPNTTVSAPPGFGPIINPHPATLSSPHRQRSSSLFSGDGGLTNHSDLLSTDRPHFQSLNNTYGGFGNAAFDGGLKRANSHNGKHPFGSVGPLNSAAPGLEKFRKGSGGSTGRLMVFGDQH